MYVYCNCKPSKIQKGYFIQFFSFNLLGSHSSKFVSFLCNLIGSHDSTFVGFSTFIPYVSCLPFYLLLHCSVHLLRYLKNGTLMRRLNFVSM